MPIARAVLVAALLSAASGARAGHVVDMTDREGRAMTLRIEGNRWRVDRSAARGTEAGTREGRAGTFIYDGRTRTFYQVDAEARTFVSVSQAQVEAQMTRLQGQLKEAMARMSPEQREQLEQAMKRHADVTRGVKPEIKYERTSRTGSAAGHRCTYYRESLDGDPDVAEVCVASFSEVGVRREDFEALQAWQGEHGATHRSDPAAAWASSPGVPLIQERRDEDGTLKEILRVTSIKRAAIPESAFVVPAGFTRKRSLGD